MLNPSRSHIELKIAEGNFGNHACPESAIRNHFKYILPSVFIEQQQQAFPVHDFTGFAHPETIFIQQVHSHDHDRIRISGRIVMAPGRDSDVAVLRQMRSDLPEGSVCHGDKIYNDHNCEDMLREAAGIILSPIRKKNSVRAADSRVGRPARQNTRKRIGTAFVRITNFFPKKIHAVTPKGFFLKVISFIISFSFHCLIAQFFTYIASHITIRPFKIRI